MSDISASERRLSAALDRIDRVLEAGSTRRVTATVDAPEDDRVAELAAENTRLATELAALRVDRGEALDAQLAEARTRLSQMGEQAARLVAANEDLAAANRALIDAAQGEGAATDAALDALAAEVEALRAARAAEVAQMGDIMGELDRLLTADRAPAGTEVDGTVETAAIASNHDRSH